MDDVGSSFSLPFKSPDWLGTFALMGVITLIPILGAMNLFGWVLTQLDYYRAGRTDIPPAGLHYINRGINVFVAQFVWGLPTGILILAGPGFFYILFFAALAASSGSASNSAASNAAFFSAFSTSIYVFVVVIVIAGILGLILRFLTPAIWIATERRGVGGGLNPRYVWSIATANVGNTLVAALLEYAASLIGGLGILFCYVGYIVTAPYGWLVFAGILRHYEYALEQAEAQQIDPMQAS